MSEESHLASQTCLNEMISTWFFQEQLMHQAAEAAHTGAVSQDDYSQYAILKMRNTAVTATKIRQVA